MDITIYLYHNNRIFYDMDIPANSSICNECDNRTYIKFIDIVMWTLRREMLYTQGKRLWIFALKTDLLVEMLLLFRYGCYGCFYCGKYL